MTAWNRPAHPAVPDLGRPDVGHWETLLPARDQERLRVLRAHGAELHWSRKELLKDDGQCVVHHLLEARHPDLRGRLGASGPVDFRYGQPERLVQTMVRSVLGQALAKLATQDPHGGYAV